VTDYRVTITPAVGRPVVTIAAKKAVSVVLGIPGPPGPQGLPGEGVAVSPVTRAAAGEVIQILGSGPVGIWDAETQERIAALVSLGWPLANIAINYVDSSGQVQTVPADALSALSLLLGAALDGVVDGHAVASQTAAPAASLDGYMSLPAQITPSALLAVDLAGNIVANESTGTSVLPGTALVGSVTADSLTSDSVMPAALLHLPNDVETAALLAGATLPAAALVGDLAVPALASSLALPAAVVLDAALLEVPADRLVMGTDLPPSVADGELPADQMAAMASMPATVFAGELSVGAIDSAEGLLAVPIAGEITQGGLVAPSALTTAGLTSELAVGSLAATAALPGSALIADASASALLSSAAATASAVSGTVSVSGMVTSTTLAPMLVEAAATSFLATGGLILNLNATKGNGTSAPNGPTPTTWEDLSGNNLDMLMSQGGSVSSQAPFAEWVSGTPNRATFVAADDSLHRHGRILRSAILEPTKMTLEMVLRFNTSLSEFNGGYPSLLMKYQSYGDYEGYGLFMEKASATLFWRLFANGSWCDVPVDATDIADDTINYHHIVCTWDGRYSRMYIDNVEQLNDGSPFIDLGDGADHGIVANTGANIAVSGTSDGITWGSHSNVDISVIRIYSRALSAAEVSNNYTNRYEVV